MENTFFKDETLNLAPTELNSRNCFYNFYRTISEAAEQLDKEMRKGTCSAGLASIRWANSYDIYKVFKKKHDLRCMHYFDDLDFPYLVYGIDMQNVRQADSLYHHLLAMRDYESMNYLVDAYDAIQARKLYIESLPVDSMHYRDCEQFIINMQLQIDNIVKDFFNLNSISNMGIEDYNIEDDIDQCRFYLSMSQKRITTLTYHSS